MINGHKKIKGEIVVVEDNEQDLVEIEKALNEFEARFSIFKDGLEALSYIENNYNDISLIILAKTLPNLNGMQLLSKIKSNDKLKLIPVIMQTIDNSPSSHINAIEQGVRFYIDKPVKQRKLFSLLKASMRKPVAM